MDMIPRLSVCSDFQSLDMIYNIIRGGGDMADKVVKVYSTPTCPWCRRTKQFLENNGIKYQDLNVADDKAAREEMINVTHQMSVPTIMIDNEMVVGFKEAELKEKLGIK
jgi:glutaredoxin 3